VQNCLDSFKEEIDNLIKFNVAFSSNSQLKTELASKLIDFNIFKMTILQYATTTMSQYNTITTTTITTTEDSSIKLRNLQHLNEVLNCFLLEEYFENRFDPKF